MPASSASFQFLPPTLTARDPTHSGPSRVFLIQPCLPAPTAGSKAPRPRELLLTPWPKARGLSSGAPYKVPQSGPVELAALTGLHGSPMRPRRALFHARDGAREFFTPPRSNIGPNPRFATDFPGNPLRTRDSIVFTRRRGPRLSPYRHAPQLFSSKKCGSEPARREAVRT